MLKDCVDCGATTMRGDLCAPCVVVRQRSKDGLCRGGCGKTTLWHFVLCGSCEMPRTPEQRQQDRDARFLPAVKKSSRSKAADALRREQLYAAEMGLELRGDDEGIHA